MKKKITREELIDMACRAFAFAKLSITCYEDASSVRDCVAEQIKGELIMGNKELEKELVGMLPIFLCRED